MNDHASNPERVAIRAALAAIEADYPAWHCWAGAIAGLVYARRNLSSPPRVVRAVTTGELRAEVEEAEKAILGRSGDAR
jgi:hypothetical protein